MKASPIPAFVVVSVAGLALYLLLIFSAGSAIKFDEPFHIGSARLLDQYGFGVEFLRHLPAGPGPLFALLHHALAGFTGLRPPWIRLVNPVLFVGIIVLLNRLAVSKWLGWNLMGSPFMSIPIGLALTEMPAMFLLCGSLLLLFQGLKKDSTGALRAYALGIAGGFCFGLAMWGRQTYIIILPAFLALWKSPRDFVTLALYGITALAMVCPLFVIWHGLVPPFAQEAEAGLKFDHGFLAFAFLGLATAVIEPRFFIMPWKWAIVAAVGSALLNLIFKFAVINPMGEVTRKFLPPALLPLWVIFASSLFTVLAAVTLAAYGRHVWNSRHDPQLLFSLLAVGLILLGCIKVTQSISSRYITTAMPLWLIGLQPLLRNDDRWKAWRFAAAIALGAVILWSYLHGTRSDDGMPNQSEAVATPAATKST